MTAEIKDVLPSVKTIIDTAKEIKAGGESAHQVIGEIGISLERLLSLNKTHTIKHTNGTEETIKIEPPFEKEYLKGPLLLDRFFDEVEKCLNMIYANQREERKCRYLFWGFVVLLSALIIILLQSRLPVQK